MKLSDILNVVVSVLTFVLVIFLLVESSKHNCFSWLEYVISFSTLFVNIGINILAAIGR